MFHELEYHGKVIRSTALNGKAWFVLDDICNALNLSHYILEKHVSSRNIAHFYNGTFCATSTENADDIIHAFGLSELSSGLHFTLIGEFFKWVNSVVFELENSKDTNIVKKQSSKLDDAKSFLETLLSDGNLRLAS